MPIMYQKRIYRADVQANRYVRYVFGDNDQRKGLGGQAAEMRGEPNAIGVRTKKSPLMSLGSFYTDDEFSKNCLKMTRDLTTVEEALAAGWMVVIPLDGLGTGFSQMPEQCPLTFKWLQEKLAQLKKEYEV